MNNPTGDNLTFEESLAQLERIVRDLEEGQLGLDESLARYERGVGLLKHCYTKLNQAEQRILLLTGSNDDGKPITRPFRHSATAETGGTAERGDTRKDPEILF
jgi:exodeoxyribonuclease VII small subunit